MQNITRDVVILGSGLCGNLAAAYLRKNLPDLQVTILGDSGRPAPRVGESIVEYGSRFFHQLGLGPLLEEKHYHKYGLTFYFKQALQDPRCRTYRVHESPGVLRMPAYHIDRKTFDDDLRRLNRGQGVHSFDGKVTAVDLGRQGEPHRVQYRTPSGDEQSLTTRWLIDATGRRRFLARKLGLQRRETGPQRSAFWLRLEGFDREVLRRLSVVKEKHFCYDGYYSTHHFFGRGSWSWLIPLRSQEERSVMSIGFVYRPDLLPYSVSTIEEYLRHIADEHPVIEELIQSGTVVDQWAYKNYQYDAEQFYSSDGWYLLGDAAMTYDPLFSFGISMAAVQVTQIASMIKKDRDGIASPQYVAALDAMIASTRRFQETTVAQMYGYMHRPLWLAWTLQMANAGWFHALLPLFMTGAFTDAKYAPLLTDRSRRDRLDDLLLHVSKRLDKNRPEDLENHLDIAVNWQLYRSRERDLPRYLSRLQRVRLRFRWRLLRHASLPVALWHVLLCAGDLVSALAIRVLGGWFVRRRGDELSCRAFDFEDADAVSSPAAEKTVAVPLREVWSKD